MMKYWVLVVMSLMIIPFVADSAFAQTTINVTDSGSPCFLNYTAGVQMWDNCGFDEDYIQAALLPWEWVTGGLFSMMIVAILVLFTYVKYHTVIYPITIGIVFLPLSFFLFPDVFLSFSIIMAFVGVGALIYYALIKQTKEY